MPPLLEALERMIFRSNYIDPGGTWTACTVEIVSPPTVSALETDNLQMVADADQWNFNHKTWLDSSALAIPLRTKIFLRGGVQWLNQIDLHSSGNPIQEVQLSFLDNAATRGDQQGTVPVIKWTGLGVIDVPLSLTFRMYGEVPIGLWLYDGTSYQMLELDITLIS